ncbi:hypothetical protein DAPPUDRAFT_310883 [Daphnia pulex]|uniref:Uncharacterized protein n=1 Tax=Daphnia pulex TaxID=6669 RepID=E9FVW3_DAPPU|nr:hypothetical protein DAPPUDRAFT_310883 [Daphnia pulex]|eukprot:EFX89031.1 hypothetical protein DAPPUDRAFT_310883 [Daphnia pulex]
MGQRPQKALGCVSLVTRPISASIKLSNLRAEIYLEAGHYLTYSDVIRFEFVMCFNGGELPKPCTKILARQPKCE